jgi:hypothetical protein
MLYTRFVFGSENLEEALESLGGVLDSRGVSVGIVVAGGSGLLLLGLIERPTADLDVVGFVDGVHYAKADPLPGPLTEAVRDVGRAWDCPKPGSTTVRRR